MLGSQIKYGVHDCIYNDCNCGKHKSSMTFATMTMETSGENMFGLIAQSCNHI